MASGARFLWAKPLFSWGKPCGQIGIVQRVRGVGCGWIGFRGGAVRSGRRAAPWPIRAQRRGASASRDPAEPEAKSARQAGSVVQASVMCVSCDWRRERLARSGGGSVDLDCRGVDHLKYGTLWERVPTSSESQRADDDRRTTHSRRVRPI